MQPAVEIEVPRRHQQEIRAFGGVFAAELALVTPLLLILMVGSLIVGDASV